MAVTKDRPLWPDGSTPAHGETIFDDRFKYGPGPWRDHFGGTSRHCPIGITSLRHDPESPYCMTLSPSARAQGLDGQAYRNISRDVNDGIVRFEVWTALMQPQTSSADSVNTASSVFMAIDSQSWHDPVAEAAAAHRGFPKLRWRIRSSGADAGSTIVNAWSVPADNGDEVYIARDGSQSFTVPVLSPPSPGLNEGKLNFTRWALWYHLDAVSSTDGKPGQYYAAEIGPIFYDLRGFLDSVGNPIGRAKTTPQSASTIGGGSFQGGFNCGLGIINRAETTLPEPPVLFISRARLTWWPPGALEALPAESWPPVGATI